MRNRKPRFKSPVRAASSYESKCVEAEISVKDAQFRGYTEKDLTEFICHKQANEAFMLCEC